MQGGSRAEGRASLALTPPPGNPRFPGLDGLRALATFSVIWFHVGLDQHLLQHGNRWLAALTFGPQLFFVMSAFLLYRPFVQARVWGTPAPTALGFWRKRALRIFPGYWVALTILAIYPGLPGHVLGRDWWLYYGLLHTYAPHTVFGGLAISWTMCIEISFYLLLPAVCWVIFRTQDRVGLRAARNIELGALAVVSVMCFFWFRHWEMQPLTAADIARTLWLPSTGVFFAGGMMLARLSVHLPGERPLRDRIPSWSAFWIGCYGLAFAIYAWKVYGHSDGVSRWVANGVIAMLVTIPPVFARAGDRGVTRFLALPVMTFLGTVAYGAYLYHRGLLHALQHDGFQTQGTLGLAASCALITIGAVALGTVSYYVVERPALRLKYRRRKPVAVPPVAEPEPAPAPLSRV